MYHAKRCLQLFPVPTKVPRWGAYPHSVPRVKTVQVLLRYTWNSLPSQREGAAFLNGKLLSIIPHGLQPFRFLCGSSTSLFLQLCGQTTYLSEQEVKIHLMVSERTFLLRCINLVTLFRNPNGQFRRLRPQVSQRKPRLMAD